MKKNRGVTIIEILISVLLISIIVILLFSLLNQVKQDDLNSSVQSNFIIVQSTFEKKIEEDMIDYGVKEIKTCKITDFGKTGENINSKLPTRCIKIVYDDEYLKENIGYLAVYSYFTRYGSKYCGKDADGNPINSCEPVWAVTYERGFYKKFSNSNRTKPVPSSWEAAITTMYELPEVANLDEPPYILYTASLVNNALNAGSFVLPIVDNNDHHYDINLAFTYYLNGDENDIHYTCDDDLLCDCSYSPTGSCDTIISGSQTKINSNAGLAEIHFTDQNGKKIPSGFDPSSTTYSYEIEVPPGTTEVVMSPKTFVKSSKYVISSSSKIVIGHNRKTVTVYAEDGTKRIYEFDFVRKQDTRADLKSLSVSTTDQFAPAFSKDEPVYNLSLSYAHSSIYVYCEATSEFAQLEGCNVQKTLNPGHNTHTIKVIAEDDAYQKTYTLNIYRDFNSDVSLKYIKVDKGVLEYTSNGMYNLYIDPSIIPAGTPEDESDDRYKVRVEAEPNADNVLIVGNELHDMIDGKIITINATALDGNTKDYYIKIKLQKYNSSSLNKVNSKNNTIKVTNAQIKEDASNKNLIIDVNSGKKEVTLIVNDKESYSYDLSSYRGVAYSKLSVVVEEEVLTENPETGELIPTIEYKLVDYNLVFNIPT